MTRNLLLIAMSLTIGCGIDSGTIDTGATDTGLAADTGLVTDTGETGQPVDTSISENTVILKGAVEKGPFILGSSVNISPVNALGEPSGQVFQTTTENDLGEFNVRFEYQGLTAIQAQGFYYNEITGQLSGANLTLRSFYDVGSAGNQSAYVNLLTHLVYGRVKQLLSENIAFSVAAVMAETELYQALGVGPVSNGLGASSGEMNILGGDTDPNAYLLAASAVIVKAAQRAAAGSSSVDAQLQQLLNTLSSDLADDGEISAALRDQLDAAQRSLQPNRVIRLFEARLNSLGLNATVPNMNRFIDTDGDGHMNASDTCPLTANEDQSVRPDALCDARIFSASELFGGLNVQVGLWDTENALGLDVDNDGYNEPVFFVSTDSGGRFLSAPLDPYFGFKSAPILSPSSVDLLEQRSFVVGADFTGDALPDLIAYGASYGAAGVSPSLLKGVGDGSFSAGVALSNLNSQAWSDALVFDYDGDGAQDLLLSFNDGSSAGVWLAYGYGDGTFYEPQELYANIGGQIWLDDGNFDGVDDLFVLSDDVLYIQTLDGQGGSVPFYSDYVWKGNRDWDGDGRLDYAMVDPGMDAVQVELGQADGTLAEPYYPVLPSASWRYPVAGLYDGDAITDLVYLAGDGELAFVRGLSGGFSYSAPLYVGYSGGVAMSALPNAVGGAVALLSEANGGELSVVFPVF